MVTPVPSAGDEVTRSADPRLCLPGGRLRDGDISVRAVASGDVEGIHGAISSDESISRWTRIPWPYSLRHAEEFVAGSDRGWATGSDAPCVIVADDDESILGGIGLHRIGAAPTARSSYLPDEVGYWLAIEARGRGIATRALTIFTRWALVDLGRPFLNLQTKAGNVASQHLASRVGYRFVGSVRATEVDDDSSDHDRYVISAADLEGS